MLKRFLPKSLLGRSLLIIGSPLVLVQLITIWFFYDRHVNEVTRRMASTLVGEIRLMLNHLNDYKRPADMVWITSEMQSNLGMRVTFKKGAKIASQQHRGLDTFIGAELLRVFRESLNQPFMINADYNPTHIQILVQAPSGVMEIITTKKKIRTITSELFVVWSIGSSVVLLFIAGIFMLNQVKPIRRLAQAADSFGKGRDVPDFKPYGAREVRQAATAFMVMRERIKRQMQQRTEMLAGISHDLRTPLTRFKLAIAMLKKGPDTEDLEQDVSEMEHMVDEYLSFAKGEGTEQAVETNLPVLIDDVVNRSQRNGVDLSFKAKGSLKVMVRPNAFKRCLGNIVANAMRYADRIEIAAARRSNVIAVTVDDNGPGVPEDKRAEVFRPFYRVDESRNPEGGGAGLGLTIARDIVRGHGGDIVLSESPLGGLRVLIRLPV